jgi:Clp amino terminal domain, pathogenicity island component
MKSRRGGKRPGAGKKMIIGSSSKRVNIAIDSESALHLKSLGGGNLSFGIRIASARIEGMNAWKDCRVPASVIDTWCERAREFAVQRKDQYVAMEHLLCTVDGMEHPYDLIILPKCKARDELIKYMNVIMDKEFVKRSDESKLRISKSFKSTKDELENGTGFLKSIELQGQDSIAARSLKKFGFLY